MWHYPDRQRLHSPITWRMCLSYGTSALLLAGALTPSLWESALTLTH